MDMFLFFVQSGKIFRTLKHTVQYIFESHVPVSFRFQFRPEVFRQHVFALHEYYIKVLCSV